MREREEERRLSIRTLAIASVAAAAAAIITSQFWVAGTPIAAAITPVIVALVSELLHRPTAVIAERLTVDRTAVLPAKGAAPPEPVETESPHEAEAPVRVYRRQAAPRRKRRIALGVVVTTAVLAFAVAAAALTIPELITGGSIGKGDRDTTLFGGRDKGKDENRQEAPVTTPEEQDSESETPTETAPEQTETAPQTETQTETAPTTPSGKTVPGG